jgi:16S rRNA G966 N2-methylase RsmD
MAAEEEAKTLGTAPDAGGNKRSGRNQRRRNQNRGKSKSRSPSVDEQAKDGNQRTPKSKSPARQGNKSQSPTRHNNNNNKSRSPTRPFRNKITQRPDMTVIVNRCDLWDSAAHFQPEETHHHVPQLPNIHVTPFRYAPNVICQGEPQSTAVARVPHCITKMKFPANYQQQQQQQQNEGEHHHCDVIDTTTPNPHDPSVVHNKYWCQRRRLFSKFDSGIQLDAEGWFSVTPEIIADHVALRVADLAKSIVENRNDGHGIVILDAFCGCGGNSIAFGKLDSSIVSRVVCVDTDRSKLLKAAHNASLYGIPKNKLIFVECNATFILKYCYKNGQFVLDQPTITMPPYMPKPAKFTKHAGYRIGGIDLLPRRIDAVFMDPPYVLCISPRSMYPCVCSFFFVSN